MFVLKLLMTHLCIRMTTMLTMLTLKGIMTDLLLVDSGTFTLDISWLFLQIH